MDALPEKIKQYWEYLLAGSISLILLILLFFQLFGTTPDVESDLPTLCSMESTSSLSAKSFDFLSQSSMPLDKNPFKLPLEPPAPPKPQPTPQKPAVQPKPVQPAATTQTEPAPVEKKTEPDFIQGKLLFSFQGKTSSAKPIAVLQLTHKNGKKEMMKLAINDEKYGFKLLEIHENEILLQDAKGKKGIIPKGKAKIIWMQTQK